MQARVWHRVTGAGLGLWLTASAPVALAAGSVGTVSVDAIEHKSNGDVLVHLTGAHANPESCTSDDTLLVLGTHANAPHMLTAALMAKATGGRLSGWIADCQDIDGGSASVHARVSTLTWKN